MLSVTLQTLCGGDTFGGEVELVCLCTHVANMFTPANTEQGFRPQDLGFCTIDDVVIADKSNVCCIIKSRSKAGVVYQGFLISHRD